MKKFVLIFALLLFTLVSACGPSGPVEVESITFHRDNGDGEQGEQVQNFEPSDETLYAEVKLNQIVNNTNIRLDWVAVDAGGEQNFVIDSTEFDALAVNVVNGSLAFDGDVPEGEYRLDVYINDELKDSAEFEVE